MKKFFLLLLAIKIGIFAGFSQTSDAYLGSLISSGNYFKLQHEYPRLEKESSEFMQLLCKAYIGSYFNKPNMANESIQLLTSKYKNQLEPSVHIRIALMMASNFATLYQFDYAVSIYEQLISQLEPHWDSVTMEGLKKMYRYYHAQRNALPLEISYQGNTVNLPLKTDSGGYFSLPVSNSKSQLDFVIDFGAPCCMVEEKYANLLGIEIQPDSIGNSDGSGTLIYTKVGFAKNIRIGEIELKNVIFMVSREGILDKAKSHVSDYEIKGIIGLPVFQAFENIAFTKSQLTVSKSNKKVSPISNLMFSNGVLFVQTITAQDSLIMQFDSGSKESFLTNQYLARGRENLSQLTEDSVGLWSFFGTKVTKIYQKPDFHCKIGTKEFTFPTISIYMDGPANSSSLDGIIGLDVILKSRKTIIDFTNMWMDFD